MAKITVYTQVHNTGEYLDQCISSVLGQTYTDFEYLIVDHASTDGSYEKLQKYAAQDSRIKLLHFQDNPLGRFFRQLLQEYDLGEYYTILDHDDWWEPHYLERLVQFQEAYDLDIACTGSIMHDIASGESTQRAIKHPMIALSSQFAEYYTEYQPFFRTSWNKLVRTSVARQIDMSQVPMLLYGGDTIMSLQLLRNSKKIGVDSSVLHHYRIYGGSQSYQYRKDRFDSDVYLYQDTLKFLNTYGKIDADTQQFLDRVYAGAVEDTRRVIEKSTLSYAERLKEYRRIAEHPVTKTVYARADEFISERRQALFYNILLTAARCGQEKEDGYAAIKSLAPKCGKSVDGEWLLLLLSKTQLLGALVADDNRALLNALLYDIIASENREDLWRQWEWEKILMPLIPSDSVLEKIDHSIFFFYYPELCVTILEQRYSDALTEMRGYIEESEEICNADCFWEIYITLAALENDVDSFLFGKIKLADYYLASQNLEECMKALDELLEMGMDENPEVQRMIGEVYSCRKSCKSIEDEIV